MKTILLTVLMMAMPISTFGALSPSFYKKAQSHAPEVMVVKIGRVTQYRTSGNRLYIKARARILSIDRSTRRVRLGRWVTIRYTTRRLSRGAFGAAAVPALKRGHTYRAYLKRTRHSRYYEPAAGAHSFVSIP